MVTWLGHLFLPSSWGVPYTHEALLMLRFRWLKTLNQDPEHSVFECLTSSHIYFFLHTQWHSQVRMSEWGWFRRTWRTQWGWEIRGGAQPKKQVRFWLWLIAYAYSNCVAWPGHSLHPTSPNLLHFFWPRPPWDSWWKRLSTWTLKKE